MQSWITVVPSFARRRPAGGRARTQVMVRLPAAVLGFPASPAGRSGAKMAVQGQHSVRCAPP